jgi:hypothetical protein
MASGTAMTLTLFTLHTKPTPIQQRAFELLGINRDRTQ